nr:membrane protein insertase YidC [uncultured Sphingomonas sp.]
MSDNRNMIMAILFSAMVLLGWTLISDHFFPTPAPAPTHQTDTAKSGPAPATGAAPTVQRDRAVVLTETPRVTFNTPSLVGSINLKGARIDDLSMVRQRETVDPNSPPVRLLSPAGAAGSNFAQFGWIGQGVVVPDANTVWTASSSTLAPGKPVTLSWSNGAGQTFQQIISVDDGYMFTVAQRVINNGSGAVAVRNYGLDSRSEKSKDPSSWTNHVGPISFLDGKADYSTKWETLDENKAGVSKDSRGGWLGFTDKYWLTALIPASNSPVEASLRKSDSGAYQADFSGQNYVVAAGTAVTSTSRYFAGAKETSWLKQYESEGVTDLSKAIDWGWFEWFMRPIFAVLLWLFHTTGNFGVAIICLTFIVRAIMYPIADKQFRSMAGMRRVQPKMKEIQEKYKDDKVKLQSEMLELYKREKINPAAGCLPILLQIPVFYALYKVLTVSVDMRHQPFVLWIKDLSAPDPASLLTLAHHFGWTWFPAFLGLSVLAVLLGVTMWMQFKLNPAQMDPTQQQIFSIMPWVLMFVMAPFAAGLQLYWVVSNILTIAQQKWLYHRYDHEMNPDSKAVEAK